MSVKVNLEIEIPDETVLGPGVVITYLDDKGNLHASARLDFSGFEIEKEKIGVTTTLILGLMAKSCKTAPKES